MTLSEQHLFYNDILQMLVDADDEFYPPLSARSSPTQLNLSDASKGEDGIMDYFEQLKSQRFLAAFDGDKLLAFVSYKENYTNAYINDTQLPNIYISTLIVKPRGRGKGITYAMYRTLFDIYKDRNIFTRTWSKNAAHIRILSKFGFEVIRVLENDRGNGIDTVYFKKEKCVLSP